MGKRLSPSVQSAVRDTKYKGNGRIPPDCLSGRTATADLKNFKDWGSLTAWPVHSVDLSWLEARGEVSWWKSKLLLSTHWFLCISSLWCFCCPSKSKVSWDFYTGSPLTDSAFHSGHSNATWFKRQPLHKLCYRPKCDKGRLSLLEPQEPLIYFHSPFSSAVFHVSVHRVGEGRECGHIHAYFKAILVPCSLRGSWNASLKDFLWKQITETKSRKCKASTWGVKIGAGKRKAKKKKTKPAYS